MVENLKKPRAERGVSQQTLAQALGISQQSANKYENHKIEPDITLLIAMADYFKVSVDYLIGRVDEDDDNFKGLKDEHFLKKIKTSKLMDLLVFLSCRF